MKSWKSSSILILSLLQIITAFVWTGANTGATLAGEKETKRGNNILWYRQPAEKWVEALPIGNGRLGAMIFGGITRERIKVCNILWEQIYIPKKSNLPLKGDQS